MAEREEEGLRAVPEMAKDRRGWECARTAALKDEPCGQSSAPKGPDVLSAAQQTAGAQGSRPGRRCKGKKRGATATEIQSEATALKKELLVPMSLMAAPSDRSSRGKKQKRIDQRGKADGGPGVQATLRYGCNVS